MTAEQLVETVNNLIRRGSISPYADVVAYTPMAGECDCGAEIYNAIGVQPITDIEQGQDSSYNKLVLT